MASTYSCRYCRRKYLSEQSHKICKRRDEAIRIIQYRKKEEEKEEEKERQIREEILSTIRQTAAGDSIADYVKNLENAIVNSKIEVKYLETEVKDLEGYMWYPSRDCN